MKFEEHEHGKSMEDPKGTWRVGVQTNSILDSPVQTTLMIQTPVGPALLVLNGDFSKEYEEAAGNGLEGLLGVYQKHRHKHRSIFSGDDGPGPTAAQRKAAEDRVWERAVKEGFQPVPTPPDEITETLQLRRQLRLFYHKGEEMLGSTEQTGIEIGFAFLVLDGDWREQYLEVLRNGGTENELVEFYDSHSEHRHRFSLDAEFTEADLEEALKALKRRQEKASAGAIGIQRKPSVAA